MAERAQGKIPPGLYLRDISEVREGADAFHFAKNKTPPKEPDNCLSLVGSELTISLELPSKVFFCRKDICHLLHFLFLCDSSLVIGSYCASGYLRMISWWSKRNGPENTSFGRIHGI